MKMVMEMVHKKQFYIMITMRKKNNNSLTVGENWNIICLPSPYKNAFSKNIAVKNVNFGGQFFIQIFTINDLYMLHLPNEMITVLVLL